MNTNKIYAESVVNTYSKKEDSKVIRLRKLDNRVKNKSMIISLVVGIVSALIFGTGMSISMDQISIGELPNMTTGVIIGVVGLIGCLINYPLYKKISKSTKDKYANDIIELAKKIIDEE